VTISNPKLTLLFTVGLGGLATQANADVFTPHFPVQELHSVRGGNTPGSFAAAAMMGAHGYNNTAAAGGWEDTLIGTCTNSSPGSLWPFSCNPDGMARSTAVYSANNWIKSVFTDADQPSALSTTLSAMQNLHSPAVVPIFGQADHWLTITQITATLVGSTWNISQVQGFDGGPVGQFDTGGNGYEPGTQIWGGSTWRSIYFRVITAINPACDAAGCTSDPYYNHYVVMWEPPVGQEVPLVPTSTAPSPGVLASGELAMSPALAQARVWNSLTAAQVDGNAQVWSALHAGVAGAAFEVNGVFPSGARWDYYLVPIMTSAHSTTAVGFVQMSTDDGSFDGLQVPTTAVPFVPVTKARAEQVAASVLTAGETLGAGILTWDPRANAGFAKSPTKPYYEFPVLSATGGAAGVVRVPLIVAKPVRGS